MDTVERLRQHLESTNISVVDFAKKSGIPQDRIYSWMRGKGNPKAKDEKTILSFIENGISPNADSLVQGGTAEPEIEQAPIPASDIVDAWKMAAQAYKETAAAKEEALALYRKMEAEREKAAIGYVSREIFGELQSQFFGVQNMAVRHLSKLTGIPAAELLVESRKVLNTPAQTQKTSIPSDTGR